VNLLGQYEHQMDEKGRVSLPSAFRRESEGDRFVLLQWEKPYLTLFTPTKWAEIQQRLIEYRSRDSSAAAWHQVRAIVANAVEVSPDKQGRILVPAPLQAAATLSGRVLLSGNIDRVELWNPDVYRDVMASLPADPAPFVPRLFA